MTWKKTLLILTLLAAVSLVVATLCGAWKQEPLRLHILANSDGDADQQIKIEVRDAVLAATAEGIAACETEAEAEEYVSKNLEIIEATANAVLEENGVNYRAKAVMGTFHFPDRKYRDVTYPEGDYRALRIVLGEGEGHNWWCVVFPPLCAATETDLAQTAMAAGLTDDDVKLLTEDGNGYVLKFKSIELWESLKARLAS